jgi:hypothetical protein
MIILKFMSGLTEKTSNEKEFEHLRARFTYSERL